MGWMRWLLWVAAWRAEAASPDDTSALAQASVRMHLAKRFVSEAVTEEPEGPMAYTALGPIKGVKKEGYVAFLKVPYVEKPERFAAAEAKKPWAPEVIDATKIGDGCIGTHVPLVTESEDCLNINIWLPLGGRKNLPVLVYFHGGMNQHGAGMEPSRSGDMTVQSAKYPVIYAAFDFRMGLFGYYHDGTPDNGGVPRNLGLRDQQQALRWIQGNIAAFGGDPSRVALVGSSFGCPNIMTHMVSPGSAGLFHRVVLVSPPVDMWLRDTNKLRTEFMVKEIGCKRPKAWSQLRCLRRKPAVKLWSNDWVTEDMTRNVSTSKKPIEQGLTLARWAIAMHVSLQEIPLHMGWHAVVDNETLPGHPRDLLAQGRWNRVPVLVTTAKNESLGIFPSGVGDEIIGKVIDTALGDLAGERDLPAMKAGYKEAFAKQGAEFVNPIAERNALFTDKVWACDIRSLVRDLVTTGGDVRVGVFAHAPKYDPIGRSTNLVCEHGAACHSADVAYLSPQSAGIFYHKSLKEEQDFACTYRDYFLAFMSGDEAGTPWKRYSLEEQAMTFVDMSGVEVVPGYRKEQCDILDRYMGRMMPPHMKRIQQTALTEFRARRSANQTRGA